MRIATDSTRTPPSRRSANLDALALRGSLVDDLWQLERDDLRERVAQLLRHTRHPGRIALAFAVHPLEDLSRAVRLVTAIDESLGEFFGQETK